MALLCLYLFLALGVSFLCSLLEASLLSLPRSYIGVLLEQGSATGRRLQRMKDEIDRPLAAILTLNTVAHTVGAVGVGAQSQVVFGQRWVAPVGAIVTLLILLFSEIVPKTLGAVHCKRLTGFTAWSVRSMILVLYPLVILCELVSKAMAGSTKTHLVSREEIRSIAEIGAHHGALQPNETQVIRNLLALREVRISDVLTPRRVVFMLPADATVGQVIHDEPSLRFARIPLYDENPDDLVGQVHRYQIFIAHRAGEDGKPLRELARPMPVIPESATVADAMRLCVDKGEQLLHVVDEHGGTEGIVTLEDAIETLLGVEIVDETDSVADMRQLAARLHEQRIRRRRRL